MQTIVRQQMVCIIAPDWPGGADHPQSASVQAALENLFKDVAIVHFASIALLPPMTEGPGQLPSLMLELAVEEGLRPYDLLARLVNHPTGAMWLLYSVYWPETESALQVSQRNQQLLDRLMSWHHIADGAFVGARDRSVRQIREERKLLEQTRAEARKLKAEHGKERAPFALALARWAFADPNFAWAADPAPRSFWRGSGAGITGKLAYLSALIGLGLAATWLVGAVARLLARLYAWLFDTTSSAVQALLGLVSDASWYLIGFSVRSLIVVLAAGFLFWLFFLALPALIAPWKRWLARLRRELDRPTETSSSRLTYVGVWIVGAPLAVIGLLHALAFIFSPDLFVAIVGWWASLLPGWSSIILGIVVLIVVGALISLSNRLLPQASAAFFRPEDDDVQRAQQVHPSIDQCEARLAQDTAHLISLTDIRGPHRSSARWTRFMLRVVTLYGRVVSTNGRLGDAPGIHFGHWHIVDNGRRLLFCSNFDGNFGGYLDDFINGASMGTTLAWRWTELNRRAAAVEGQPALLEPRAFPPTRFLAFRGVKCELKFKSYARDSMLPHLYRFEACHLTISQIDRATALRDALFGPRTDRNDDQIMRAIE
jgi:hypothetical protein